MKNALMIQSQLLILLITFLPLLLKLFTQKSVFQIKYSEILCRQKSMIQSIITSTNKEEIYKILSSLNNNKSCGPNCIPTNVLHLLQDQISNHLATIWNLSFPPVVFPAILKTASYSHSQKEF